VLKDIYSPLEIDEQWDQRAPMAEMKEGDAMPSNVDPTLPPNSEAAGTATATAEPMTPPAAEDVPTDEVNPTDTTDTSTANTENADVPHITLHDDASSTEMAAEAATDAPVDTNDDAAVAKLSGNIGGDSLEGDHVAEDATTDPTDAMMNPKAGDSVIPTVEIAPEKPRVWEDKSTKQEGTTGDNADTEPPANDSTEHFVLGGGSNNEGSTDAPAESTELPVPEAATEPEEPAKVDEPAAENTDAPEFTPTPASSETTSESDDMNAEENADVLSATDREFEEIMQKLTAEDDRLASLIKEHNDKATAEQAKITDLTDQRKKIKDRMDKVKPLVSHE
jgi:hypothetical protein